MGWGGAGKVCCSWAGQGSVARGEAPRTLGAVYRSVQCALPYGSLYVRTLYDMQSARSMMCRSSMLMPCEPMVYLISPMMAWRAAWGGGGGGVEWELKWEGQGVPYEEQCFGRGARHEVR